MFSNGPRISTTGLSLLVDAADPLSYPGSGTNWTDIVTGITGSLSGSITYASDFKGTLVVNNSSSVIIFPTSSGNFGTDSFTVELAFQPNQINGQHWLVAKNSGSFPSWGAFITGSGGSGRITAFFNISSTVSCSMSTPTGSIVTGSNYLVDINFFPNTILNTVYLNSELSGSVIPNGTGSLTATSSLFISNRNSGSSVGTPLEIFNAKLYTPRLVAGRIRQNYNALSTRLGLPQKSYITIFPEGLLDLYSGAAAAYSLRSLNSSYDGSAIRVRRSSDNTEQDIGFTSTGNLDINLLTIFCGTSDGFVTTWYDQSGNGRNATQTTAANQPQIVSSGSVILENGKPTIQFDGINDILTSSLWSSNIYGDYVFTIYAYNNVNQGGALWSNGNNPTLSDGYAIGIGNTIFDDDGSKFIGLYHGRRWLPTSYNLTTNQSLSLWYIQSNYSQNLYLNGIQVITSANIGNPPFIPTIKAEIGGVLENNRYSNVKIQEHIYYPSDQSTNRTGIESNINSYYQIY